ncbi:hypothetical protein GOP47_0009035 [Adiantum capillus-veneris]|uniref:Uncharacterized protein n=1 Tax=Adiantum capillus-veneris TaxID=13818 RepID=A0A9D4V035_ADICA|nr:hypothetical protein GOP47_0009035 [Adiantum capillus-veneris]
MTLQGLVEALILTGMGRPVPDPPQLLHLAIPDPPHAPQPELPSDHREQKHGTRRAPSHVGHRGRGMYDDLALVALSSASRMDLAATAPARSPMPDAICDSRIAGAMGRRESLKNVYLRRCKALCQWIAERERERERETTRG